MSTRVVERVDDWDQEPFSGGYHALQERADAGFSGVFRAGGAELYMTRGTAVGIRRGAIEDFEGASGTVFEAPTDALPLLAIMQEESDEVRAKYYTEDTSISEVDGTLEDGGFTGFVELSENVLSGNYYLVYHRGNSMSVGFVGNTQRLITGDEAFETTDDEVGIYEVRPVDIEPIEIPEPVEPEPEPEPQEAAGVAAQETTADPDPAEPDSADPLASQSASEATESAASEPEADEPAQPPAEQSAAETTGTAEASADEAAGEVPTEADPQTAAEESTGESAPSGSTGTDDESLDHTTAPAGDVDDTDGRSSTSGRSADAAAGAGLGAASTREDRPAVDERQDDASSEAGSETADSTSSTDQEQSRSDSDGETTAEQRRRASESLTEPAGADTEADGRTDTTHSDKASSPSTRDTSSRNQPEESGPAPSETDRGQTQRASTTAQSEPRQQPAGSGQPATARSEDDQRTATAQGPAQLETRAIPSLDPERTNSQSKSSEQSRRDTPGRAEATATGAAASQNPQPPTQTETDGTEQASTEESTVTAAENVGPDADQSETAETTADGSTSEQAGSEVAERIEELEELLEDRETELKTLESDLHAAESERDSLRRELEQVRSERDDLQAEVEKLEAELHRLEEELGAATDAQQRMTPQEALSGTDLFVRYDSKGDATLAKARDSGLRKQDVAGNLQLEKHTQFEADVAAVGGREYGEFLEDTVAYKFAHWVVYDLLFEIQSTGHTETLSDLYGALPKINRIELNGVVNATYVEDGEQVQSSETFDVVFRERMGDPLLVANINESRQGATEGMMEQLITAAERVGQTSDQFAAAFLVTESFFEPEALETVEESTRGGLLSRDKRKSYVNLSRKNGYHLCLVEARNENFHLEVPEL